MSTWAMLSYVALTLPLSPLAADSTLFEFDNAGGGGKWRERGKGEFKLNLDLAGQVSRADEQGK